MENHFSAEFFTGNRHRLLELFTGKAPIVLTANGLLQRSGDTTHPYRQDSNFWYLTGLDHPDIILVIDKDSEYLILPERGRLQDIFDGTIDRAQIYKISGIKSVMDSKSGWKKLNSRLKKVKHVATVAPGQTYYARQGFYTNPAKAALVKKIKAASGDIRLLDLRRHFVRMRVVKQPVELLALQQAVDITCVTLKQVARKIAKYNHEYEIEAELGSEFRRRGASGHSYSPIVASGVNACTLHYIANNSALAHGDLLLIDAGAEVSNYAADISRTYAMSGPSKRQRAVYDAVAEVQQFALGLLKPGTIMREYEQQVENFMGEKLRELLLIKTINRENVRKYYPHGTSHFLGLDAHDDGDYEKPLEENMVLTVEPGIYIASEKLGVRLEDDVVITKTGNRVMSSKFAKRLW